MNKIGRIPKGCGLNKISRRYSSSLWFTPQARRNAWSYSIYPRNALEIIMNIGSSFNKIKERISRLFYKGDYYLLIEILNHYLQITLIWVNLENKEILVLKNFFQPLPEFNLESIFRETKLLLKKIGKLNGYKIIVSLDSDFATTMYSSISLVRSNPKEIIDEADLDNLISQAIWRFFDKNRWRVAQKMSADDVDVILSDVRIRDIRIDGHRVVNPIGFKAKAVEIAFSQTFLIRDCLRGIRDLIPKENIALITESGTALCHILSLALGDNNFYVANLFPNKTAIFASSGERLAHHDSFSWGGNDLHYSLYRHLKVDQAIANSLIQSYTEDNASQNFLRKFENILVKELHGFSNGLESLLDTGQSAVYLNPFFTIPKVIYLPRFHSRFQKPIKVLSLSTQLITEKLGYQLQFKSLVGIKNPVSLLGAILEAQFLPKNETVSHLANRRVGWLVN